MYLKEITLRNILCFSEATLRFPAPGESGNWCVILGDNGTGKTTLLQAIALTLAGPSGLLNHPTSWISHGAEQAECEAAYAFSSGEQRTTEYTIHAKVEMLDETWAFRRRQPLTRDDLPKGFLFAGYGALRRMMAGQVPAESRRATLADSLNSLFDDTRTMPDLNGSLRLFDYMSKDSDTPEGYRVVAGDIRDGILDIANSLLPASPPFRVKGVNAGGVRFLTPGGQEVPLASVSEGHRNVFALAGALILCILDQESRVDFRRQSDGTVYVNNPGIVLIDEVDLHLHPKWQRAIGKALQRTFPNIQFIVTTHSPFVAQTASEGGLSRLRWENGTVTVESPLTSMHAWPVEEILLGPAFDLDTTRDPDIDAQLREYLRLQALDVRGQITADGRKRMKELRKTLKGTIPPAGNVYDTHTEIDMLLREARKDDD